MLVRLLLNLPMFRVFRSCAVFTKLVNLIQSSYIFIINESLKAVVLFWYGFTCDTCRQRIMCLN